MADQDNDFQKQFNNSLNTLRAPAPAQPSVKQTQPDTEDPQSQFTKSLQTFRSRQIAPTPPSPRPRFTVRGPQGQSYDVDVLAKKYGLDANIIHKQIMQESGGKHTAVSSKGAIGFMQLMPETAKELGVDPHDPQQNLEGGMRLMQRLLGKYGGDYHKALAAYNAGEERVDELGRIPDYPETQNYVSSIMSGKPEDFTPRPPSPPLLHGQRVPFVGVPPKEEAPKELTWYSHLWNATGEKLNWLPQHAVAFSDAIQKGRREMERQGEAEHLRFNDFRKQYEADIEAGKQQRLSIRDLRQKFVESEEAKGATFTAFGTSFNKHYRVSTLPPGAETQLAEYEKQHPISSAIPKIRYRVEKKVMGEVVGMAASPITWATMGFGAVANESLAGVRMVQAGLDTAFATMQTYGFGKQLYSGVEKLRSGDYGGGLEDLLGSGMDALFAVPAWSGAINNVRMAGGIHTVDKVSNKVFNRDFKDLPRPQREQVSKMVLQGSSKFKGAAQELASAENARDLVAIKKAYEKFTGQKFPADVPKGVKAAPEERVAEQMKGLKTAYLEHQLGLRDTPRDHVTTEWEKTSNPKDLEALQRVPVEETVKFSDRAFRQWADARTKKSYGANEADIKDYSDLLNGLIQRGWIDEAKSLLSRAKYVMGEPGDVAAMGYPEEQAKKLTEQNKGFNEQLFNAQQEARKTIEEVEPAWHQMIAQEVEAQRLIEEEATRQDERTLSDLRADYDREMLARRQEIERTRDEFIKNNPVIQQYEDRRARATALVRQPPGELAARPGPPAPLPSPEIRQGLAPTPQARLGEGGVPKPPETTEKLPILSATPPTPQEGVLQTPVERAPTGPRLLPGEQSLLLENMVKDAEEARLRAQKAEESLEKRIDDAIKGDTRRRRNEQRKYERRIDRAIAGDEYARQQRQEAELSKTPGEDEFRDRGQAQLEDKPYILETTPEEARKARQEADDARHLVTTLAEAIRSLQERRDDVQEALRQSVPEDYGRLEKAVDDADKTIQALSKQQDSLNEKLPPEAKPDPERDRPAVPIPPRQLGSNGTIKTARGSSVDFQYAVVEARQVEPSHDSDLNPNPNYPARRQPRNRNRAFSKDQFLSIGAQFDPSMLGENFSGNNGAPVVGDDLFVDGGNMRSMVLKFLYQIGDKKADEYKAWLAQNYSKFGVDSETVAKMRQPMLVRIRRTPLESIGLTSEAFSRELNEPFEASMSQVETAKADSQAMTPDLMSILQPSEDGNLFVAGNQGFIQRFFSEVISPADRSKFMMANGQINQDGVRRIQAAIFAKAFPGSEALMEKLSEDPNNNIRAATKAMLAAAPKFAQLNQLVDEGTLHDLRLSSDMVEAARKLSSLREQGQSVADYLSQGKLYGQDISPAARELLTILGRNARRPANVSDILNTYADDAMRAGRKDQGTMFGGAGEAPDKAGLLRGAMNAVVGPSLLAEEAQVPEGVPAPPPPLEGVSPKQTPQQAVEAAGAKFVGIQKGYGIRPDMVMFQPEDGGTSLQVPVDQATPEAIRAKIEASAKEQPVKPETVPPNLEPPKTAEIPPPLTEPKEAPDSLLPEVQKESVPTGGWTAAKLQRKFGVGYGRASRMLEELRAHNAEMEIRMAPPPEDKNTIFPKTAADAAIERMKKRRGRLQAGIDPEDLKDIATVMGYHVERGIRSFADVAKKTLETVGEWARPHLEEAWKMMTDHAWERAVAAIRGGADDKQVREKMNVFREVTSGKETATEGGLPNAPPPLQDVKSTGKIDEPGAATVQPGAGGAPGGVPGTGGKAGTGRGRAARTAGLSNVAPAELTPQPERTKQPAWKTDAWKKVVNDARLPPNARIPTQRVFQHIADKLIFPGQDAIADYGLSELLDGSGGVVLGLPTGVGKSYLSSAIVRHVQESAPEQFKHILYLTASRKLVDDWVDVAKGFGVNADTDHYYDPKAKAEPPKPGVYATTMDTARNRDGIEKFPWDLVVVDEAGQARGSETSKRGGLVADMGNNAKKVMYLSATPFTNAAELQYLTKLGLWKGRPFDQWVRQFGISRSAEGAWQGHTNPFKLEKLRQQLIERGQFINQEKNFDGFNAHFAVVPLTPEQVQGVRNIDRAFALAREYYQRRGSKRMMMVVSANKMNYLKHYIESTRIPATIEMARRAMKAGYQVPIFSETHSEVNTLYKPLIDPDASMNGFISKILPPIQGFVPALKEAFGEDFADYSGGYSSAREKQLAGFQTGQKKVFYTTYAAGGLGLSLHDTAGDAPRFSIYHGLPWSGYAFEQGAGRTWRYGTKSDTNAAFLLSNVAPEVKLVVGRIVPRLEALNAVVNGVDFRSPLTEGLSNANEALQYEHGDDVKAAGKEFTDFLDTSKVFKSHKQIDIADAKSTMGPNKGMKVRARLTPPPREGPKPSGKGTFLMGVDPIDAAKRVSKELKDTFRRDAGLSADPALDKKIQDVLDSFLDPKAIERDMGKALPQAEDKQKFVSGIAALAEDEIANTNGNHAPVVHSVLKDQIEWMKKHGGKEAYEFVQAGKKGNVSMWQFALRSGRNIIDSVTKKSGMPELGGELNHDIQEYHAQRSLLAGNWMGQLVDWVKEHKITPENMTEVWEMKEGEREVKQGSWQEKAVQQLQDLFFDVQDKAVEAGVQLERFNEATGKTDTFDFPKDRRPGYMPRIYDEDVFKFGSKKREEIVSNIMRRRGISRVAAETFLDSHTLRDVPLSGNLERTREHDIEGYEKTLHSIYRYLNGAAEAIGRTKVFGQKGAILDGKLAQLSEAARRQVRGIFNDLLMRQPFYEGPKSFLTFASDWVALTKMNFTAIPMMFHSIKSGMFDTVGVPEFARSFGQILSDYPAARRAAIESGAIAPERTLDFISTEYGVSHRIGDRALKFVGVSGLDQFSRVMANKVAENFLTRWALPKLMDEPQHTYRHIARDLMGVPDKLIDEAIENGKWSDEAVKRAGARWAAATQGTNDPTELPPMWRLRAKDEAGQHAAALLRTTVMLKAYVYRNGKFFSNLLMREAMRGNFRPWVPFLMLAPAGGELFLDLQELARGRTQRVKELGQKETYHPLTLLHRVVEDAGMAIGASLVSNMIESFDRFKGDKRSAVARFALGPYLWDALQGATSLLLMGEDVVKGEPGKIPGELNRLVKEVSPAYRLATPPASVGGGGRGEYGLEPTPRAF